MGLILSTVILVVLVSLNIAATLAVWRDALSEPRQKVLQLGLVWLVPLLGAVVTLAVHRKAEAPSRRYREQPDPGDDYAVSGRSQKALSEAIDGD